MDKKIKSLRIWAHQSALHAGISVFFGVLIASIVLRGVLDTEDFFSDWKKEIIRIVLWAFTSGVIGVLLYKNQKQ